MLMTRCLLEDPLNAKQTLPSRRPWPHGRVVVQMIAGSNWLSAAEESAAVERLDRAHATTLPRDVAHTRREPSTAAGARSPHRHRAWYGSESSRAPSAPNRWCRCRAAIGLQPRQDLGKQVRAGGLALGAVIRRCVRCDERATEEPISDPPDQLAAAQPRCCEYRAGQRGRRHLAPRGRPTTPTSGTAAAASAANFSPWTVGRR